MKPSNRRAALVLAAGKGSRFGPDDKLLARFAGAPLGLRCVNAARSSGVDRVFAVVPRDNAARRKAYGDAGCKLILNDGAEPALGASIALGFEHLAHLDDVDEAVLLLADMPLVTASLIDRLFAAGQGRSAAACSDGNHLSPPVVFSRSLFPALIGASREEGASHVLSRLDDLALLRVPRARLEDVDTPSALARISHAGGP